MAPRLAVACFAVALASCGGGGGSPAVVPASAQGPPVVAPPGPPVVVPPGPVAIAVSPSRAALTVSRPQQFVASVTGSSNTGATWSVDGQAGGSAASGTVSASGMYVAPAAGGRHTITATSQANPADSASAFVAVTDLPGVFTFHNDAARTGQNLQEYALDTVNVADPTAFGRLFSCAVDAAVYAQPLYAANLAIGTGIHNVVFVVTENDSVYAFDADGAMDPSTGNCLVYWYRSFLTAGVTAIPSQDTGGARDQPGTMGITGTPVIGASTIYLVARLKSGTGQYSAQLRALDIASGNDRAGSPATIAATVAGTAQGTSTVIFNALTQSQRPALLLSNGTVYIAFGSAADVDPYNGWLIGYDAATLVPSSAFNSSPSGGRGSKGGFWMGGSGPAADSNALYVATANGVFDNTAGAVPPVAPSDDMGDSLLKFDRALAMRDFFTPASQASEAATDWDFGAGGVVVLPDSMGSASHPHLVVATGKPGNLYLVDRDAMGRYLTGALGTDANVQTSWSGGAIFSAPALWGNIIYVAAFNSAIAAFPVSNGQIGASTMQTPDIFAKLGASASVSALGPTNGVLWALDNSANGAPLNSNGWGPAVLRAYDAANLGRRLFSSDVLAADACGNAVKFTVPTIANGRVYVGGGAGAAAGLAGQLTVYGLKP